MKPGPAAPASPVGPAGGSPPPALQAKGEISLHLEPKEISRGTPVRLSATGLPSPGTTVEWLVNGDVVPAAGGDTLDTANLRRNDSIRARARGPWGTAESEIVTVRNSPPEIRRVGFVLPEHKTGRPLAVEAEGYDADGDPVRFDIAWKKTGEPAGTGDRVNVPVRGGDKIVVTVTPFDGESFGQTATLYREVRSNVIIERQEQFQASGNVLRFRIVASGDGGTPLTYSLKDAPHGMRIDPATGWVRWEVAPGQKGKIPFDVQVSDGAGAEASARFTATIPEDEASAPK
jgi:hypothetical protein